MIPDSKNVKFVSVQNETTYQLTVIAESRLSGEPKQFTKSYQVTEFFDTYGYMHRQQVKEKVIDQFVKDL